MSWYYKAEYSNSFGLTMEGISSKAAGGIQNKEKTFQGQRFDDELGLNWVQFKWRNHDPQIGRFVEIDPLSEKYVYNSTYAFSENKVIAHVELEGLESEFFNAVMSWALPRTAENPNSAAAHIGGAVYGFYKSFDKMVNGISNAIKHPVNTTMDFAKMTTFQGQLGLSIAIGNKINEFQNAKSSDKTAMVVEAITDVATAVVGTKGVGLVKDITLFSKAAKGTNIASKTGLTLESSVSKVMGSSYKAMGEVIVPIKNTELLNSLNATSKGNWVKVYEAGIQNGTKIETHYFRNNTTNQVFDVKTKYDYWHQKAFKKLGE